MPGSTHCDGYFRLRQYELTEEFLSNAENSEDDDDFDNRDDVAAES